MCIIHVEIISFIANYTQYCVLLQSYHKIRVSFPIIVVLSVSDSFNIYPGSPHPLLTNNKRTCT